MMIIKTLTTASFIRFYRYIAENVLLRRSATVEEFQCVKHGKNLLMDSLKLSHLQITTAYYMLRAVADSLLLYSITNLIRHFLCQCFHPQTLLIVWF